MARRTFSKHWLQRENSFSPTQPTDTWLIAWEPPTCRKYWTRYCQQLKSAAYDIAGVAVLVIRSFWRWKNTGKAKTCGQETDKDLNCFATVKLVKIDSSSSVSQNTFWCQVPWSVPDLYNTDTVKDIKASSGAYTPKAEHCFILSVTLLQNQ